MPRAGEPNDSIASTARQLIGFIGGLGLERTDGRAAPTSDAARDAQYDAIVEWGIPEHGARQRLTGIQSPTLVIQGDADLMIPPKVSHLMAGLSPDAQIRIRADAAHGFLFQYPAEVAADINSFLAAPRPELRS